MVSVKRKLMNRHQFCCFSWNCQFSSNIYFLTSLFCISVSFVAFLEIVNFILTLVPSSFCVSIDESISVSLIFLELPVFFLHLLLRCFVFQLVSLLFLILSPLFSHLFLHCFVFSLINRYQFRCFSWNWQLSSHLFPHCFVF